MAAENNSEKRKPTDERSLFLYTALIFLVAIIMIIVAFFAQTHLDKSKVSEAETEKVGLSEKAAQVSEENMQLVELNKSLKSQNTELESANTQLTSENERLSKEASANEALLAIYKKLYDGDKKGAREDLQGIYSEDLSQSQKTFYDILVKKSQ